MEEVSTYICTSDDFFIDAPTVQIHCPYCGIKGDHLAGWISVKCLTCNSEWNLEDTMPDIVKKMRKKLKLNRTEIGKILGYSKHSVKKYELVRCTKPYYEKIQEYYRDERNNKRKA